MDHFGLLGLLFFAIAACQCGQPSQSSTAASVQAASVQATSAQSSDKTPENPKDLCRRLPGIYSEADLGPLLSAARGIVLANGPWSEYTYKSMAVVFPMIERLQRKDPSIVSMCLQPDGDGPNVKPYIRLVNSGPGANNVLDQNYCLSWYAKGTSSPLMIFRNGEIVASVQSPYRYTVDELEEYVVAALGMPPATDR